MNKKIADLAFWIAAISATCAAQTGERGVSFVVLCTDGVAIRAESTGIASISLRSHRKLWRAATQKSVYVGPVVAGDAVAFITDSHHVIYAFSKDTGRRLWRKEVWSSNIGTDGNRFYMIRTAYWDLQALEPATGRVEWSLKLPGWTPGHYPRMLGVHGGLLFTTQSAVDLSKKAVVHTWLGEREASSASVNEEGEIVIGDTFGGVTIYDRDFKTLKSAKVGGIWVAEAFTTSRGVFAATFHGYGLNSRSTVILQTDNEKMAWRRRWTWEDGAPVQTLAVSGDNALLIEPGRSRNKMRLTSRKLPTGGLNWMTPDGIFEGPPVVCGDTVYVDDLERIRAFDLQSGSEKKQK